MRAELLGLTIEHPIRTGENQKVLSTGEVRWFAWTNRALFNSAGQRIGYQSTGRDITEAKRAELMLQETAAELALIADAIPLAVAIARTDRSEILFANSQAKEAFGLHPGGDLARITASTDAAADFERLVAGKEQINGIEVQMRRADGSIIWALLSARSIQFRGAPALLVVITDITARRAIEQVARKSEARFVAAAESIPDGLAILMPTTASCTTIPPYGTLAADSAPSLRMGVHFEDWIREGLTHGPVFHADMGPDYAQQRLNTRREERTDREHKQADGRWVRIREARMPDGGRVLLTVDVTARREAEEALKQSEARYRAVVEGQTEFILRLRPDGILTFVNDAFCRYCGLSARPARRLRRPRPLRARAARGSVPPGPACPPDGRLSPTRSWTSAMALQRFEEWTDTAIFDADQLVEIQSVGRDISERKHAEDEVRRQREARTAGKAGGPRFAAGRCRARAQQPSIGGRRPGDPA